MTRARHSHLHAGRSRAGRDQDAWLPTPTQALLPAPIAIPCSPPAASAALNSKGVTSCRCLTGTMHASGHVPPGPIPLGQSLPEGSRLGLPATYRSEAGASGLIQGLQRLRLGGGKSNQAPTGSNAPLQVGTAPCRRQCHKAALELPLSAPPPSPPRRARSMALFPGAQGVATDLDPKDPEAIPVRTEISAAQS